MSSASSPDPKRSASLKPLVDLDDPAEVDELEEPAPDTARPDYASDKFAKDLEAAAERMTQPPVPTYDMLRDSCKTTIVDEVPLDEEEIIRPSRKFKITPR